MIKSVKPPTPAAYCVGNSEEWWDTDTLEESRLILSEFDRDGFKEFKVFSVELIEIDPTTGEDIPMGMVTVQD